MFDTEFKNFKKKVTADLETLAERITSLEEAIVELAQGQPATIDVAVPEAVSDPVPEPVVEEVPEPVVDEAEDGAENVPTPVDSDNELVEEEEVMEQVAEEASDSKAVEESAS